MLCSSCEGGKREGHRSDTIRGNPGGSSAHHMACTNSSSSRYYLFTTCRSAAVLVVRRLASPSSGQPGFPSGLPVPWIRGPKILEGCIAKTRFLCIDLLRYAFLALAFVEEVVTAVRERLLKDWEASAQQRTPCDRRCEERVRQLGRILQASCKTIGGTCTYRCKV